MISGQNMQVAVGLLASVKRPHGPGIAWQNRKLNDASGVSAGGMEAGWMFRGRAEA